MKTSNETAVVNNDSKSASTVSFDEAFRFWLWLGFVSFGGPAGQIAIMQRELVERKKWIDQEDFLHALNFCMLLPGPEAQQLATYNGWKLHGTKGGIAAGTLFVLPSVFILLVLSYFYAAYGNLPLVSGAFDGLKAVVLAIVIEAVFKVGKRALKSWQNYAIAFAAFVSIYFLKIPFPLIVIGAAIIGVVNSRFQVSTPEIRDKSTSFKLSTFHFPLSTFAVFVVLWLIPLLLTIVVFGWRSLPMRVYLFFTQAAFVTFGGAYAVLAYVNQAAVENFGWITREQAVDGFALAETTPGPLIMVLQNVGFMTGWNNAGNYNQTFFAIVCALLTTFATFLPSFLFIFTLAPFIEKLRDNKTLKSALAGVTAAVVGVILTLALTFGATVILPDNETNFFALIIGASAFAALFRFNVNVLWLIFGGAFCGVLKVLLQL
ncbi:MAG: chromate efflux transporter [Pyrinomonadaceae bacterium]|nr:chromate efflux transporter [Pyrinomonadaceae bacterium]